MDLENNLFLEEDDFLPPQVPAPHWEMLVVDDETDVHHITRVVLDDFSFENKKLTILNAYSAEQAQQLLQHYPNIALILLDVVMETHDAGLKLVHYIRETLGNRFIRIVLRTGQPGYAPEKEVIQQYDINDYTNKIDLTAQKLFTLVTANLRAYSHILIIEAQRRQLETKVNERTQELQKTNKQLNQLNQELSQKNKSLLNLNQEKNEFLSIAAHNLKNPLSAIGGLADMIVSDFDELSSEEIIKFTKMIRWSSEQMFNLVTNLLNVAAIEGGQTQFKLVAVDVLATLQALITYYQQQFKAKNLELQLMYTDKHYLAYADTHALQQVLDNLLSNAIKYSPPNTTITLRLEQDHHAVRCHVQDQGPGISEAEQPKLFGKFTRLTTRPTAGEHSTGLGLFIVKKLIEAMQGQVWYQSQAHPGGIFTVQLLRYQA